MSGITYQEAVARINRCIAEIKAVSMDNDDPMEWLEVGYFVYKLERVVAESRKDETA